MSAANGAIPPRFCLNTIASKPLSWIWRNRIPAGRLSLLVGHPDQGKSLVAVTLAAHVNHAWPWPDGTPCPQGKVIFLESEDSLQETVVPRLVAAGADLAQIESWHDRNLDHLADHLTALHPKLIVLSPLNTYLPKGNTWSDSDVRRILQPLADLAESSGAAILGIMHPPKKEYATAIHNIVGSMAFVAVARSVLTVERRERGLYLLESLKGNLSRRAPAIGYRINSWANNPDVAKLEWAEVPTTTLLMTQAPPEDRSALQHACEFLQMVLASGMVTSRILKREAEKEGINPRTLMRARSILGIEAIQIRDGHSSHWELRMPRPPSG